MDKKKIYESWLNKKIEVPDAFTDRVMNKIFEHEQRPRWFDVQKLIETISAHAIFKNGLIAAGALIGFLRVIYIMSAIFSKGVF